MHLISIIYSFDFQNLEQREAEYKRLSNQTNKSKTKPKTPWPKQRIKYPKTNKFVQNT